MTNEPTIYTKTYFTSRKRRKSALEILIVNFIKTKFVNNKIEFQKEDILMAIPGIQFDRFKRCFDKWRKEISSIFLNESLEKEIFDPNELFEIIKNKCKNEFSIYYIHCDEASGLYVEATYDEIDQKLIETEHKIIKAYYTVTSTRKILAMKPVNELLESNEIKFQKEIEGEIEQENYEHQNIYKNKKKGSGIWRNNKMINFEDEITEELPNQLLESFEKEQMNEKNLKEISFIKETQKIDNEPIEKWGESAYEENKLNKIESKVDVVETSEKIVETSEKVVENLEELIEKNDVVETPKIDVVEIPKKIRRIIRRIIIPKEVSKMLS